MFGNTFYTVYAMLKFKEKDIITYDIVVLFK